MPAELLHESLKRFDSHFSSSRQKVLLWFYNDCAHGFMDTVLPLENVDIYFHPLNVTSKIQSCDASIIATTNMRYRGFSMSLALDLSKDKRIFDFYMVDIFMPMRAWKRI